MKNKFVRSCQKNSKEVQEALFALGYTWTELSGEISLGVQFLEFEFLCTRKDGTLGGNSTNKRNIPCLYDFTEETKLVATLKPVNNELTELREQADALMAKIKEMEAKQCEA